MGVSTKLPPFGTSCHDHETQAVMIACTPPTCFVGHAPAKLNLFFEIHGKRSDGYHDVCSLCCPINLFDTLIIEPWESSEITLTCEQAGIKNIEGDIPTGTENLAVQALELVRKRYGVKNGCRIRLIKRIPSQAGLGGGSSDAATALRLACKVWNLRLSLGEMLALGAELGSDVPLFFVNGMSIGLGRGELVQPIDTAPRLDFVVVKPPEGISTAEAFRGCKAHQVTDHRSPERLVQGLSSGNRHEIAAGMFNRLETTAQQICPTIGRLSKRFEELDCSAFQMTGSGSACFALCHNQRQAQRLASRLRLTGIGDIFVAHSVFIKTMSFKGGYIRWKSPK